MKKFDANGDGIINEEDYKINRESMLLTDKERKLDQEYTDYKKNHPYPLNKLSADELNTLLEKGDKADLMGLNNKKQKYIKFSDDIINLIKYWQETKQYDDKMDFWQEAIDSWFKEMFSNR